MARFGWSVAVFTAGFLACALALQWAGAPPASAPASFLGAPAGQSGSARPSIAEVVQRVSPTVVSVEASPHAEDGPPLLRETGATVASGVLVHESGLIVTNHHAVENARRLRVRLWDGTEREAALVGSDYASDLALLRIVPPARGLPVARFGAARGLRPGDPVIAIGNPLGFHQSVSVGVVSAVRRGPLRVGGRVIGEAIQTDAAINQGSSGGGLFDMEGRLIGINTALVARPAGGGSVGIAFAIPVHVAEPVIRSLLPGGAQLPEP